MFNTYRLAKEHAAYYIEVRYFGIWLRKTSYGPFTYGGAIDFICAICDYPRIKSMVAY